MKEDYRNIYKSARQAAGLTQERWAEVVGISVESVRLYKTGRGLPSDDVVTRMAEVSVMPVLGYWHLKSKSAVANDILPEVERIGLPQAVIQLLVAIRNFKDDAGELLDIAADGVIDFGESKLFNEILQKLDAIVRAALTVKYAEGGYPINDRK